MDRSIECPGPCNPRNKVCRSSCLQNILTVLEELPPCIRMRMCQEDILSVFGNLPRDAKVPGFNDPGSQDSATSSGSSSGQQSSVREVPFRKFGQEPPSSRPRDKETETEVQCPEYESKATPRARRDNQWQEQTKEELSQTCEEQTTQTEEDCACKKLMSFTMQMANTIVTQARSLSTAIWNKFPQGPRTFSLTSPGCSCRTINSILYTSILILIAAFASQNYKYQIFLSSQICGIIAILCWRISRTVPL